MGDVDSKRDRIAAGRVVTSVFLMEIFGTARTFRITTSARRRSTSFSRAAVTLVAGGGMDGVEGRHPAQSGDAYFFRLNGTVG